MSHCVCTQRVCCFPKDSPLLGLTLAGEDRGAGIRRERGVRCSFPALLLNSSVSESDMNCRERETSLEGCWKLSLFLWFAYFCIWYKIFPVIERDLKSCGTCLKFLPGTKKKETNSERGFWDHLRKNTVASWLKFCPFNKEISQQSHRHICYKLPKGTIMKM